MVTMKKRMLALALALTMIVGLGGQAWAEVLPGVESTSPEVSTQPENSASPEGTEAPQETTAPEETDAPEESAAPAESETPEESTAPEEETDEAPVETPILDEPYVLPGVEDFAVTQPVPRAGTYTEVKGLEDVVGTTIDVFDYWLTEQNAADNDLINEQPDRGINQGHLLLFGKSMSDAAYAAGNGSGGGGKEFNNNGNWNGWTGNGGGPVNGIVNRTLGEDGYPRLGLSENAGWTLPSGFARYGDVRTESLAYLFDPDYKDVNGNSQVGKTSYTNVGGLLRVDDNGYYYYDSNTAFASLRDGMMAGEYQNGADGVNFKLYTSNYYDDYGNKGSTTGGVGATGSSPNGQFFPFNQASQVFGSTTIASNDSAINHYFGLHMQSRFVQQYGGHTDASETEVVTYKFSGDDDVWIFIDDVLVADLGGIHDAVQVDINFFTGDITISSASKAESKFTAYTTTLRAQFVAAGKDNSIAWSTTEPNTFADDTYHTLDFFYLERGNTDSNMNLKYNLVSVPESSIVKVDQTGDPVPGAKFELWTANQAYEEQTKVATGTTDENGQFVLVDNEGYIVSLQEVWNKMSAGDLVYDGRGNLILKEAQKPAGYRSGEEYHLYLVQSGTGQNARVLLLSDNYWETGAYAYTNSTISMDGQIQYRTHTGSVVSETLSPNDNNGTLFAVVLRRTSGVGNEPTADNDWKLVTGNPTDGWNTSDKVEAGQTGIGTILQALKETGNSDNYFVAQFDASGAWKTTASELPGDVMTYYHMLDANNKAKTEYIVAFYYTTAGSVEAATSDNTYRVTNSDSWEREFSSNVYVPNIKNRIFVQKLAPDGTALPGATFQLYYDEDCTQKVPNGTITTRNFTKDPDGIDLDGAGVYPTGNGVLENRTYYLKETSAPQGYAVNPKVTKIIVDNTGVYADAGEANDGIVVARGMGSIVKSMAQFASLGDIDVTLNNIVAKFYTVPSDYINGTTTNFESLVWRTESDGEFQANTGAGVTYHPSYMYDGTTGTLSRYDASNAAGKTLLGLHMEYATTAGLEYDVETSMAGALGSQALHWMTTDTGWSKLMMEQCFQHSREMEAQGYNVTNLTSPTLYELTNLFSGTVIVQVTDQHTTSLTITKDVTDAVAGVVQSETYSFTVEKLNADGNTVDNTYTGSVQVKVGNANPRNEQFADGVLTVSCQGENTIQILNLADGTYRVTENTDSMGNVNVNGDTYVWQDETYTSTDNNVSVTQTNATATINSNAEDTANASVTVTNNYASEQTLTVTKTVGGNMGDTTKDFTFTMTVNDGGTPYSGNLDATKTGGALTEADTTPLTSANGSYTFTLTDSQEIAIQIPYGYTATVTETAVDGYTTTWRSYTTETEATETNPPFANGVTTGPITMNDDYTVDYLNECDMTVPPSGVDAQNPGISVMLGVAAGSAVLIFGCSFLVWRRRRRDWM